VDQCYCRPICFSAEGAPRTAGLRSRSAGRHCPDNSPPRQRHQQPHSSPAAPGQDPPWPRPARESRHPWPSIPCPAAESASAPSDRYWSAAEFSWPLQTGNKDRQHQAITAAGPDAQSQAHQAAIRRAERSGQRPATTAAKTPNMLASRAINATRSARRGIAESASQAPRITDVEPDVLTHISKADPAGPGHESPRSSSGCELACLFAVPAIQFA